MIVRIQRITITRTERPALRDVNQQLQWIGSSLGLFSLRDKNSSCFRIFIELIKSSKAGNALSSDEMAYRLGLSRGTVIHHLNRLSEAGIVVSQNNRYSLRVSSIEVLIDEIERDLKRACEDLKEIAKKIDKDIGI